MPTARLVSAKPAVAQVGVTKVRQAGRPDCSLAENATLPACANPGQSGEVLRGGAGGGGGVSGAVLGVLAAGAIGTAVAVAAKNDSNG